MALLEIRVLGLSECLVSEGFVLDLDGNDAPGIHYILSGTGLLHIAGAGTVALAPHTLLIVPPRHPLKLEVPANQAGIAPTVVSGREHRRVVDSINRFRAGTTEPTTVIRMRQAATQLRTGDLALDQVARNAGYASRGAFMRAFREIYGTGPAEYRAASPET